MVWNKANSAGLIKKLNKVNSRSFRSLALRLDNKKKPVNSRETVNKLKGK